jgi:hypothetical protein
MDAEPRLQECLTEAWKALGRLARLRRWWWLAELAERVVAALEPEVDA